MSDVKSQIEALKQLFGLYDRHGYGGPKNWQLTFPDSDAGAAEAFRCLKEIFWRSFELRQKQSDAQRKLLASGFPVPDHWLELELGVVSDAWERGKGTTIKISGIDESSLDRAAKEINLAIVRSEAQADQLAGDDDAAQRVTGGEHTSPKTVNGNGNGNGNAEAYMHAQDFRSVRWYGAMYMFTRTQAAAVEILWDAGKGLAGRPPIADRKPAE